MDSLENFSVLDTSMFLNPHCTPLDIRPALNCCQSQSPIGYVFADSSSVTQLASLMSMPSGSKSTECRRPRKGRVLVRRKVRLRATCCVYHVG